MWKPLQQHFFAIVKPTYDNIYNDIAECRHQFPWLLQALMYTEENNQTGEPIWNYPTGAMTSWKGC